MLILDLNGASEICVHRFPTIRRPIFGSTDLAARIVQAGCGAANRIDQVLAPNERREITDGGRTLLNHRTRSPNNATLPS